MSEVFEGYERQYCELSVNLSRKCSSAAASGEEEKEQKITEIKAGLDEADMLVRKMDLEARSLQPNTKTMLLAKLREYKSDLTKLKREAKRLNSPSHDQIARAELLEAGMIDTPMTSSDYINRSVLSTERLGESSDRLREAARTALETEQLGVSILEDLHLQRETLLHSHQKKVGVSLYFGSFVNIFQVVVLICHILLAFQARLQEADNAIDKSKKVLTAMSRRINKNKSIVGTIIAALIIAIIIVVYFKVTH